MELLQTVISLYPSPFLFLWNPFHVANQWRSSSFFVPLTCRLQSLGAHIFLPETLSSPACTPPPSSESPSSLAAPSGGCRGSRGSRGSVLRPLLSPSLCSLHSRATSFSLVLQYSPSAGGWHICPGWTCLPDSRPVDRSASCVVLHFWKAPPASPIPARRAPHPLGISRQPSPFWRAARTSFLMLRRPQFSRSPLSQMTLPTDPVVRSHPLFLENISRV